MRTVREHLAEGYVRSGSFKMQIATALSKALDANDQEEAKKRLRALVGLLQEDAARDKQMKEACEKGMDDELGKRLVPSNVSGVVDPSRAPAGLRMIPRSGQPTPDMPKVDMQFEHLVKVDN